jgi:2-dehydro-3-deoxygluconokinase
MLLVLAEPGVPLAQAHAFRSSIAGAESNVAIGLARLGFAVEWVGRLGGDPAGEAVLRALRADGVGTRWVVRDPAAPTGLLLRDSHPARPIDVQYYRAGSAASRLRPDELGPELLRGAKTLHLTGITAMLSDTAHAAVLRLFDLAAELGVLVSFDPNIRYKLAGPQTWREVVGPLLRRADLLFTGADELAVLTGRPAEEAAAKLHADGVDTVVVKHADKSASALVAGRHWHRPAFTVPVVDPVGAGDAFVAGYLSAWLRGADPDEALLRAAAVAALVVQSATDNDGLPTAAHLERSLAALTSSAETVHR